VFEVNTSDQRDGKHLLAQLQEATQSHQLPRTALVPSGESQQNMAPPPRGDLSISLKNLLSCCHVTVHEMIILMYVKGKEFHVYPSHLGQYICRPAFHGGEHIFLVSSRHCYNKKRNSLMYQKRLFSHQKYSIF